MVEAEYTKLSYYNKEYMNWRSRNAEQSDNMSSIFNKQMYEKLKELEMC